MLINYKGKILYIHRGLDIEERHAYMEITTTWKGEIRNTRVRYLTKETELYFYTISHTKAIKEEQLLITVSYFSDTTESLKKYRVMQELKVAFGHATCMLNGKEKEHAVVQQNLCV